MSGLTVRTISHIRVLNRTVQASLVRHQEKADKRPENLGVDILDIDGFFLGVVRIGSFAFCGPIRRSRNVIDNVDEPVCPTRRNERSSQALILTHLWVLEEHLIALEVDRLAESVANETVNVLDLFVPVGKPVIFDSVLRDR